MCLPDFIELKDIKEEDAIVGYRNWRTQIQDGEVLISENQDYIWPFNLVSHKVTEENSGIYSYNNYYNYYNYNNYNNNYNYYNYNYYYYSNYYNNNYYNNNYYNYYNIAGIIKQFGKVAIHKIGYRSEYAKVDTLFLISELDVKGTKEFLNWIKIFNNKIIKIAERYGAKTLYYQDFVESQEHK